MKITDLLGEATEYDKKQAVEHKKVKSWLKSVSAFANTAGGTLIFGITDGEEIVGLENIKSDSEFISQKWRMITGCIMKPPVMIKWIPSGIILGLRMDVAEENLVVSMAKEAGIKNIYKSYINTQNKLDAYLLKA